MSDARPREAPEVAPTGAAPAALSEGQVPAPGPADAASAAWFTMERLGWLIRLRWVALSGMALATVVAASGAVPGVNAPVLGTTVAAAAAYNYLLYVSQRRRQASVGSRAAVAQALGDFLTLTMVLWAAGGIDCPFVAYYIFHVALAGILAGPRATLAAAGLALGCASLLWLVDTQPALQVATWDPVAPWDAVANGVVFVTTLAAVAYLVTHAVEELRDRERALEEARNKARIDYEILSRTLDEFGAGLEVIDGEGNVFWRNRVARELSGSTEAGYHCPGAGQDCERDDSQVCPLQQSLGQRMSGRCRFASRRGSGGERLYELHSFPLTVAPGQTPRAMNLYLDRTSATLAERQLVLAERLASLGRVAQGVAHELNTPLATIRTLAADMGAALGDSAPEAITPRLLGDVRESAALIREETGRLGRITQSLLAGGDLVTTRVSGNVPLSAVVERACALVFAGSRAPVALAVDPGLAGLHIAIDSERLIQVLVNLLSNAHDAVREQGGGAVNIAARRLGPGPGAGRVEITVADDGPGIDDDIHGRLFEPFATTKPPGEGTGLGLYTSYMLVRAMHGTLELSRRPEGGTLARLELPGTAHLPILGEQAGAARAHGPG